MEALRIYGRWRFAYRPYKTHAFNEYHPTVGANRRVDKRSAIDRHQNPIIHTNNHGAIDHYQNPIIHANNHDAIDHVAAIKKSLLIHHTNFQPKATLKI